GQQPCAPLLKFCILQAAICNPSRQIAALDELHAEVMLPRMLSNLVDWNDVGVVEAGSVLGLGAESNHVGCRGEFAGKDHLKCYHAVEASLPCLPDKAHAAARNLFQQLIVAKGTGDRGGRGV